MTAAAVPSGVRRDLAQISTQIEELETRIRGGRAALLVGAPSVSGWTVGQHVDHLLKALKGITTPLEHPEIPGPNRGLNWLGRFLFLTGRIRRGVAQSPERVRGEQSEPQELEERLEFCRARLLRLAAGSPPLRSGRCVDHPALGGLTAAEALRFVRIHQAHHLVIIREIEAAAAAHS